MSTQRQRLERAFETLHRQQRIAALLVLAGSTGVIEQNLAHYRDLAAAAGMPGRWVADSVGAEEYGGADWDAAGTLRYCYSGLPVQRLLFSFSSLDCGRALAETLDAEGFRVIWDGSYRHSVEVDLTHALVVTR